MTIGHVFLGKYRVDEILGHGGMGVVAKCHHLQLNDVVAIKMLRKDVLDDADAVERFVREAQASVKLRSEYVARVSDVGRFENGVPYMVMEFLDGHDLGELLDQRGCLPVPWATELMLQAAEALAEAHSIGIVHRDVKPTNLFVTWRPDGTALIKVLDFGIARAPIGTDLKLTQTQSLLGTPAYMSPEQMRSARMVDARSDIWSLGTVMYELIEGRRPFEAESFSEMCVKVAVDPPAPMVNAPPALAQVVLRCLAKSPEQRFATMAELGAALRPFARDPHAAGLLVERMQRMIDRGGHVDWAVGTPMADASGAIAAAGGGTGGAPIAGAAASLGPAGAGAMIVGTGAGLAVTGGAAAVLSGAAPAVRPGSELALRPDATPLPVPAEIIRPPREVARRARGEAEATLRGPPRRRSGALFFVAAGVIGVAIGVAVFTLGGGYRDDEAPPREEPAPVAPPAPAPTVVAPAQMPEPAAPLEAARPPAPPPAPAAITSTDKPRPRRPPSGAAKAIAKPLATPPAPAAPKCSVWDTAHGCKAPATPAARPSAPAAAPARDPARAPSPEAAPRTPRT